MIDYAHELDIRVVVEGIETAADLAATRALGADLGQGWYIGRPAAEPVPVASEQIVGARAGHVRRIAPETRDWASAAAR